MNKKFFKTILLSSVSIALLTGCNMSQNKLSSVEDINCKNIKPVQSLEQTIRKISSEEGFTARIENYTQHNPTVYAKDFSDLRNELQNTNLDFEIHNYADAIDIKKVSIFLKGERYTIDKELLKIDFVATNIKYITIGDVIKIFKQHNYNLFIPTHLHNKPMTLTMNATYKLSDLLNEVSNHLISLNIQNNIKTKYDNNLKQKAIIVELEELNFKYPQEKLLKLSSELKKYSIPNKIENSTLYILGNYKQQLHAKDIIEKRMINFANIYVVCLKNNGVSSSIAAQDDIEVGIDTYESIKITKINKDENGIEEYRFVHKTKDNKKEYKLKTNEKRINITKDNINAKIYLY